MPPTMTLLIYEVNVVTASRLPERSFLIRQISHAYFCFVSVFCSHVNTLKQNNFTETKHCFAFVLFQFYFSYNHGITKPHSMPVTRTINFTEQYQICQAMASNGIFAFW